MVYMSCHLVSATLLINAQLSFNSFRFFGHRIGFHAIRFNIIELGIELGLVMS